MSSEGQQLKVGITSLLWGNPAEELLAPWLEEVKSLGYDGVSGFSDWGWQSHVADQAPFFAQLKNAGLELASMIVPLDLNFDRYRRVLDLLDGGGGDNLIILGGFGHENREFDLVIDMMNYISEMAKPRGIHVTYHNHTDNTGESFEQFCRITDGVDATHRSVMVDVGHATKDFVDIELGERSTVVLDRYGPQMSMIELKDFRPSTGLNTALGHGQVNLQTVAAKVKAMDYKGWLVVEQNGDAQMREDGSATRSARESRSVVRNLFGV